MSESGEDCPLLGRLARAVSAVREEELPVIPLERALSRARAIEPRSVKTGAGRAETWRNRISSLFDQLEDRDLLSAAAVCCVAPAEAPISTASTARPATNVDVQSRRKRAAELFTPTTCVAGEDVWAEALTDLWCDEEELTLSAPAADWVATSTACADWTWPV